MPEHNTSNTTVLDEDGVSKEDLFRRATFNWAISTKRLVEASVGLGKSIRVTRAALSDVEYARDLLDKLFLPSTVRGAASSAHREDAAIKADDVKSSVSDLVGRISNYVDAIPSQRLIALPSSLDVKIVDSRRGIDLSAPVRSKNGKMLWADKDCPSCPSKAHERCRKPNGEFVEKPHKQRLKLESAA